MLTLTIVRSAGRMIVPDSLGSDYEKTSQSKRQLRKLNSQLPLWIIRSPCFHHHFESFGVFHAALCAQCKALDISDSV